MAHMSSSVRLHSAALLEVTGGKLEDKNEGESPDSASQQTKENALTAKKRFNLLAFFLGFGAGLAYLVGVWYAAYSYAWSIGFAWQTEMPFGLAAPDSSPAFLSGLGVGSLLLLIFLILLPRPLGAFGKGVAVSYLPFGLAFLYILLSYSPKGPAQRF